MKKMNATCDITISMADHARPVIISTVLSSVQAKYIKSTIKQETIYALTTMNGKAIPMIKKLSQLTDNPII